MGVDMRPRWVRQEKPSSSKVNKRRRAVGGCTCCTKELFPADWARFLLPWLLVLGFAALFLWVRGFGWLLSSLSGTAKFTATFFSEWSFVLSWSLCVWSLAVVHYASPGFIPLALTARSVAIDLLEPRVTAAKDFHWELKAYGPRVGELRTCKRNPAVQLTPFGSKKAMRICPVKPDRAHFCFFTGRTVLEMDHYCPWLGNCIGYGTRKPFLLSLWHGLCMGSSLFSAVAWDVVLAVSALPRAVAALPLFAVLVLGLFVMAILGVFFGYHFGLAASNYTTIENHERRLAPRTQKVPSKLDVRTAFANQDSFGDAVRRTFPSSNPRKASLFVVFWREWAYTPSPWDHGTLSNLTHYFGAFLTWGMPIYLGIKQWQPWDVSMVPASHGADLTMAGGKLVQQDAPLEPVGVTVQSLTPRSALVSAAEILTTGRG